MYSRFFGREKSKAVLISSGVRVFTLLVLLFFLGKTLGLIGLGISILTSSTIESIVLLIISKFLHNKMDSKKSEDAV